MSRIFIIRIPVAL